MPAGIPLVAGNAAVRAGELIKRQILELAVQYIPKLVKRSLKQQQKKDPDSFRPNSITR
jgi:hypothetical protein